MKNYLLAQGDKGSLLSALKHLCDAHTLGLDTETTGLSPHEHKIRLVQISGDMGEGKLGNIVIDVFAYDSQWINLVLQRFFTATREIPKILANAKFDYKFFKAEGIHIENIHDVLVMYKLLLNGMCEQYPTLVTVTNAVLGTTLSVKDKKEKQKEDWGGELTPEQLDYAAGDTLYLHEVFKRLKAELQKDSKLWGVYTGIEIPCLYSTADMEFRGVPTDVEVFEQLAEITVPKQLAVKEELLEIFSSVGRKDVNLNSWQQLLPAFNDLGSPIPNTQATTLEECDHPAAVKLLEYKAYKKTLEFVVSLPKFLSPSTERVHGNFNGQGTETGRFSASKPK